MKVDSNYYVYAYFDPRNYEMFYVGKGKDSRKNAHHPNKAGTAKERQIHEIERAGQKPLIRIIATNLTDEQAYLVEKALIWRSGKSLTNLNSGKFAENFRPPNTLHQLFPGFDTDRGIFFVNVGGHYGPDSRQWEDCYKFNFLAAGGGLKYSEQLNRLSVGDIVAAYLSQKGYVGVGRVVAPPIPSLNFRFNGHPLTKQMLKGPGLLHDKDDQNKCDYLVGVKWIRKVSSDDARKRPGTFAARQIVASLSRQPNTLKFLEQEFRLKFDKLLAID
jgi:hypothetical protein